MNRYQDISMQWKLKIEVLNLVSWIKIQCARSLDICNDSSKSSQSTQWKKDNFKINHVYILSFLPYVKRNMNYVSFWRKMIEIFSIKSMPLFCEFENILFKKYIFFRVLHYLNFSFITHSSCTLRCCLYTSKLVVVLM